MTLEELNNLSVSEALEAFEKCCGSSSWINKMTMARPFPSKETMMELAETKWQECGKEDWLEAFTHHPKIGDISSLAKKFANTKAWAGNEQKGMDSADNQIIENLAKGNRDYENKFGFIFIVCATGKSAQEMLDLLEKRLPNHPEDEIKIAAGEQNKITKIRLEKLLS